MARRHFVRLVAAAVASISMSACADAAPAAPPSTSPVADAPKPSGSPPAVAPSEVLVGVIVSRSGRFSREGALLCAGYETWAEAVQQAGGVRVGAARRVLRLVVADDESEPLTASRQAERLAAADNVRLWLGPFSAQVTTAVATVADRVNALLVAPDASASALYQRGLRRIVSILPTDNKLFHGFADLAASTSPRAEPVGILIADEPSHAAAVAGFRERAEALGLGSVHVELTSIGARDVTFPLSRLAEHQPRLVILATEPGQTARFTPTFRELLPFATMRAVVPLPEPALPSGRRDLLYDGVVTVESWWPTLPVSGPVLGSAGEFAARFQRLHGYEPEPRCAAAAAAGLVLQLAVEQAGATDAAAVREAFSTLDVTTFWGRLAWDIAGRNRVGVAPVLQQQGDSLVAVYPRESAGGRLRYPLAGWPRS